MTRINAGVDPRELSGPHLLAEHREIKRIPNAVVSGTAIVRDIPVSFRLGPGHVRFFYDKLGFLLDRYLAIRDECWARGYRVQDFSGAWDRVPRDLMGDWTPEPWVRELVLARIRDRLTASSLG